MPRTRVFTPYVGVLRVLVFVNFNLEILVQSIYLVIDTYVLFLIILGEYFCVLVD